MKIMPRKVVPEWNSRGRSERTENDIEILSIS